MARKLHFHRRSSSGRTLGSFSPTFECAGPILLRDRPASRQRTVASLIARTRPKNDVAGALLATFFPRSNEARTPFPARYDLRGVRAFFAPLAADFFSPDSLPIVAPFPRLAGRKGDSQVRDDYRPRFLKRNRIKSWRARSNCLLTSSTCFCTRAPPPRVFLI